MITEAFLDLLHKNYLKCCYEKTKLIVVLGMHRSGTSILARSLQTLGVELGDYLIPGSKDINIKGYWEDVDINTLNNEMLAAINSSWHQLTSISHLDIDTLRNNGYDNRATELLLKKVGNVSAWGFKDPRVAKLLPFWEEVLYTLSI